MKRFSLLIWAAVILAMAAGCGNEAPETDPAEQAKAGTNETQEAAELVTEAETEPVCRDDLPDDLDFGGQTFVFATNNVGDEQIIHYDIGNDALVGEMVEDAVFNRNIRVQERLNFKMEKYVSPKSDWNVWAKEMKKTIMAGDDVWQIVVAKNNATLQSSMSKYFMDLSEMDYLDITKDYWWHDSIMGLSLDGKSYSFLLGDAILEDCMDGAATLFNKDMYQNLYDSPDEFYQMALDGKWTLDKLTEMCADAYSDVNGNGVVDDGDQVGMRFNMYYSEPVLLEYGCNLKRMYRDSETGIYVVDYDQEKMAAIYDKLYKLLHNTVGLTFKNQNEKDTEQTRFVNGLTLFKVCSLKNTLSPAIRNMSAQWGIVPCPKFDEAQEDYIGVMEGVYMCVPVTVQDAQPVGAIMEALASDAHENVIEEFYSEALMAKYSPDEESSKCIKLIADSVCIDPAYSYLDAFDYLSIMIGENAALNKPVVSAYASKAEAAQKKFDKYVADYLKSRG